MTAAGTLPLKKRIALRLFSAKRKADALAHELHYLFWECTLRCNMSCLHCGSDCMRDSATPDMPVEHFLGVLDRIASYTKPSRVVVAITGGEPLMREDLAEAGLKINRRGFPWGMVTNGYLLTAEKMEQLLASGIRYLTISLDGLADDHEWLRGKKDAYRRACRAIGLAARAREKGLSFDVVTCVNRRNIRQLDRIQHRLVELGAANWRLTTIFPKGRAAENGELKLDGTQLTQLMDFIAATRREGKIDASYGCDSFLGGYEMEVRRAPFFCWAGVNIGSVLVDGSISACPSLRADYIQGNIYQDDFIDVWNNRFAVMRKRKWLKSGECAECKLWNLCLGNGLHLRREKDGKLLSCLYHEMGGV
ncbi:MAG: TIGR04133 family radical SAM/SPASM protein [Chitinispirillaceae bacterium]|nr:TIGR04133 family radical SAM/SPASM protein [Chitinispirillaceae bacterium]